jgi:hypothetical protein
MLPIMTLSLSELTSQRPLFKIFYQFFVLALFFLVCYMPLLFVAANPVLCYFMSMLCVLPCARVVNTIMVHGFIKDGVLLIIAINYIQQDTKI